MSSRRVIILFSSSILLYEGIKNINGVCKYTVDSNGNLIITQSMNLSHAFDDVVTIAAYGYMRSFSKCTGITAVSFPNLVSVGDYGLCCTFLNCTGITGSITFPKLTTIGNNGMANAFSGCTGITSAYFPALTTVGPSGLSYVFENCFNITSIHFRADSENAIRPSNANIYTYFARGAEANVDIFFDL